MSDAAARAEAALRAVEREADGLEELRKLHERIEGAAQSCASATVAVLSLLPFIGREPQALDLVSDAIDTLGTLMGDLLAAQQAGFALIEQAQARADAVVADFSVKV